MGLLPDTQICGLCMRRESRERIPCHRGLAIPTCITARASRMRHDVYHNRLLAISLEVVGVEIVPGIPGACSTSNFTYLVRFPWWYTRLILNDGCNILQDEPKAKVTPYDALKVQVFAYKIDWASPNFES